MPNLRSYTEARVALGAVGHGVPTVEALRFRLDHARARDAVHWEMGPLGIGGIELRSAARNRAEYLRRPDLGRRLDANSRGLLQRGRFDAAFVVADGLSALAVERHAKPLLDRMTRALDGWTLAPICVVRQGRVAIGDEIGELLGSAMVAVLIGERPGLSSHDSLGVYLTYDPRPGRTDAERNCISNIRDEGLSHDVAAHRLLYLMREARARRITGIGLEEEAGDLRAADSGLLDIPLK